MDGNIIEAPERKWIVGNNPPTLPPILQPRLLVRIVTTSVIYFLNTIVFNCVSEHLQRQH